MRQVADGGQQPVVGRGVEDHRAGAESEDEGAGKGEGLRSGSGQGREHKWRVAEEVGVGMGEAGGFFAAEGVPADGLHGRGERIERGDDPGLGAAQVQHHGPGPENPAQGGDQLQGHANGGRQDQGLPAEDGEIGGDQAGGPASGFQSGFVCIHYLNAGDVIAQGQGQRATHQPEAEHAEAGTRQSRKVRL